MVGYTNDQLEQINPITKTSKTTQITVARFVVAQRYGAFMFSVLRYRGCRSRRAMVVVIRTENRGYGIEIEREREAVV